MACMSERSDAERLAAVMNALAERAAAATDQEIRDDAEAGGVDLRVQGARVRAVLADTVLRAKKQRLRDAGEQHKRSLAALGQRTARLPVAPATRRALVARVIARRPETRQQVM